MQEITVHYLAVLVAGIAAMGIGFVWYSPLLFGNAWMKLTGRTKASMEKEKADMPKVMGMSFVAMLIMAYVLRHVTVFSEAYYNIEGVAAGIQSGFWMWLGFVTTVQFTAYIYEKLPFKLYLINTGYQLTSLLVMGAIVGGWV